MAAINFPDSPINGQTYEYAGTIHTYKDTGSGTGLWRVTTPGSVGIANTADIDTGTDNVKYITPAGLASSDYKTAVQIFNLVRPVGSYFESELNVPPTIGTWAQVRGKMLFAEDGTSGYAAGNNRGSKNAVAVNPGHTR
mgnify:CR=1 FL=1